MTAGTVNIFRSAPRVGYTPVPNSVANDERLSARDLGVLYYILTKPPGWRVLPAQLCVRFRMSYRLILKVLAELQKAGYVKREVMREDNRIVGTRYLVSDEPGWFGVIDNENINQELFVDFAACSKSSQPENQHTVEKKDSNKLISSAERAERPAGFQESKGAKRVSHAIGADRGAIEAQIAARIGDRGFDVLMALPEVQVDQLCAQQRRGTLDDRAIAKLRS